MVTSKRMLLCVFLLLGSTVHRVGRAQPAPAASTLPGLAAYWPFDEGAGDVAGDLMSRHGDLFGHTGSAALSGQPWTEGRVGKAISFAGDGTELSVRKTGPLQCGNAVTVAAWVKLDAPTERGFIVNHEMAYRLCVNQGRRNRVRFQLSLDGAWAQNWLVGQTSLEPGRWYHVAGVYDGAERKIYIDGTLDAREEASGTIGNGGDFTIGTDFSGAIDEIKVWGRALPEDELRLAMSQDRAQVEAMLTPEHALSYYPVRSVVRLGKREPIEIAIFNGGQQPFSREIACRVVSAGGTRVYDRAHDVSISPGQKAHLEIEVEAREPGAHELILSTDAGEIFRTPIHVLAPGSRRAAGTLRTRPLLAIDLAEDLGPDMLCDDGTSRVVDSPLGRYREAGEPKFSRFVVRTRLKRTGLHLFRVTYPDDKVRLCEIITSSPAERDRFNAQTGYFTGVHYPLSMRLQTVDLLVWARDVEHAVVFTTWLDGQPAAAAKIEVFEVDGGLPAGPASAGPNRRDIGLYWEDAQPLAWCFGGDGPSLAGFDEVASRLCDYMDYTGQNALYHPAVWYSGPIYNSLVEPRGAQGGQALPTAGWMDILLKRFEERGLRFYPTLNVHQLPSLLQSMNADGERVAAGEPTYNTVSKDNEVRSWTRHHRPPLFNAIHPRVKERVLALIDELASRHAPSPAFAGVALHLTMCQLLQLGTLDVSYDDWSIERFEEDAGIAVPVDAGDPERFGKRYEWLMENARDEWIAWRCRRVTEYYAEAARLLRSKREDLQLVLSIWDPPMAVTEDARARWEAGETLADLAREGGIDPALLGEIPGVVIQKYLGPTDYRRSLTKARPGTEDELISVREMDFAEEQLRAFSTTRPFGVYFHNRYFESAIGRQQPLECDWFRSIAWRASAIVPSHDHFMEYYAHAMAAFDPGFIAIGGFTNGTVGHERQVERFARVFRALPIGDWQPIPDLGEEVVGRTLQSEGRRYLYLVNRGPIEVSVTVPSRFLEADPEALGGSPALARTDRGHQTKLGPYQLAAWMGRGSTGP